MEEVPFEDRFVPKAEIDWERSAWWWYPLSRAVHPALRVTALLTSALGVLVLWFGISQASYWFQPRFAEDGTPAVQNIRLAPTGLSLPIAPLEIGQSSMFRSFGLVELAYVTFCALWCTAVLGFFGGVLSRRAAIELGQRTIAPWGETVRVVGGRMSSYMWVTGMQLVAVALLLIIPFVLGLFSRLGPLAIVTGFLLILCLPLAFVVGRVVLSIFICFPLAVVAISCEKNADAFEGYSRSNNYFFQRPVLATLCVLALAAVGWIGSTLIYWWLLAGWHWIRDAYLGGAGYNALELMAGSGIGDTKNSVHAMRITEWILRGGAIVRFFFVAFWFSYFWSGAAAVYLILRRSVDNTLLDEIDTVEGPVGESLPMLPESPATPPAANA